MNAPERRDPGVQAERTALAWRRTVLALLVGPLVALRLLPAVVGWWGIVLGVAGLAVAAAVAASSVHRERGVRRAVAEGRPLPGALPMGLAAAAIAAAAATCLVLTRLLQR